MNWKNIAHEKPALQKQILVLIKNKVASVAKFNGDCFTEDELEVENVTHWAYLPELPIMN